jgi:hypothetical protein
VWFSVILPAHTGVNRIFSRSQLVMVTNVRAPALPPGHSVCVTACVSYYCQRRSCCRWRRKILRSRERSFSGRLFVSVSRVVPIPNDFRNGTRTDTAEETRGQGNPGTGRSLTNASEAAVSANRCRLLQLRYRSVPAQLDVRRQPPIDFALRGSTHPAPDGCTRQLGVYERVGIGAQDA